MSRRTYFLHFLFVSFSVLVSVFVSSLMFSCRQEAETSSVSFSLSSEALKKIFDGGGRGNSDASRTLTDASEYTLEISVEGDNLSVSETYAINAPDGKKSQEFSVGDLPSEISVRVNVSVFRDGDILWKTKKIPTVILSPGDNFVNLEMTKVQSAPETPDDPGSDEPENPSVKDAEYTVNHMVQKLSEDKASVLNDYEIREEEKFSGKIGEETSASAKNYEGFTA